MTVSRDFSELNFDPIHSSDVVGIEVVDAHPLEGQIANIGYSKRKTYGVPRSSNAYWNWMNLRKQVVAWESHYGICRKDRQAFERALNETVRWCHRFTAISGNATQYFLVSRKAVLGGVVCSITDITPGPVLDEFGDSRVIVTGWYHGSVTIEVINPTVEHSLCFEDRVALPNVQRNTHIPFQKITGDVEESLTIDEAMRLYGRRAGAVYFHRQLLAEGKKLHPIQEVR